MWSGVAHGHPWAILPSGYAVGSDATVGGEDAIELYHSIKPEALALLSVRVLLAIAHPLWMQFEYNGWDRLTLEESFENAADAMGYKAEFRFWRS